MIILGIKYNLISWDTKLFNQPVYEILEFDEDQPEFDRFEKELFREKSPYMVFSKIIIRNIGKIHFLEQNGFSYIETQFHITKKITQPYEIKIKLESSLVLEEELPLITEIARTSFTTDRYSIDPNIGHEISGQRYQNWILDSFNKDDFLLYKYILDKEIIGFTLMKIENKKAYGLLGGVKPDLKGSGLGLYMNLSSLNMLYNRGIRLIDTYISAANIDIFNIDIFIQYQIKDVKVVLRKIYV